jgi:hypothetical protein
MKITPNSSGKRPAIARIVKWMGPVLCDLLPYLESSKAGASAYWRARQKQAKRFSSRAEAKAYIAHAMELWAGKVKIVRLVKASRA